MNVLELCLSQSLGGLELYFHRTCKQLSKNHRIISVVKGGSRLEKKAENENFPFYSIKSNRFIIQSLSLLKLITKEKTEIIHVHHKDDLPLCAIVKLFSKQPFKIVHTRQMALPSKKKDPYHRFLYSQIDCLIVISKQLQEAATANLPVRKSKIKLLYYGVSAPLPGANPFKKANDKFKVGMFSRIGFKKGYHTLLEALNHLKDKGYGVSVHIYGDIMEQDYYDRLQTYIRHHKLKDISFEGFRHNPGAIMGYFDAIVVPSLNETFGLVAVEAMLMKTAVVATDCGGLQEIIEHEKTGLLFESQNAHDLACLLERLIKNPNFGREIAENGQKSAQQRFDEGAHYEQLIDLMRQTMIN